MDTTTAFQILTNVSAAMMGNLQDHKNAQQALEVVRVILFPEPKVVAEEKNSEPEL